jgi:hypothetical protein
MSHHFDTKRAKNDPSMNICDTYVFNGLPGHTVMAMTINADAGISAPDTLPLESMYTFRFDANNDAREEVLFKFRFGQAQHVNGDERSHVQPFQVRRAEGDLIKGDSGDLLIKGETGKIATTLPSIRAFVRVVPELWAADAIAFFNLLKIFYEEDSFEGNVFLHQKNFFRNRNVMALVLEVPNSLIGTSTVHLWSTGSLYGHAPEIHICRWGPPVFTRLYLSDPIMPDLVDKVHASSPADNSALFADAVAHFTSRLAARAGSTADPEQYGKLIAARLWPVRLPYELGTEAAFGLSDFNSRPLATDAYDVMLQSRSSKWSIGPIFF